MIDATAVGAVNTMTARWARAAVADEGTVFAATGVWPLLALLAGGAGGPARQELEDALGVGADRATALGGELLGALDGMDGVDAATGLWTRQDLPIRSEWEAAMPPGVRGALTGDSEHDRKELDAWASRCTRGAIAEMPVPLSPATQLVLAGALTVRTAWLQPFQPGWLMPKSGPWRDRSLAGLTRSADDLDGVLRVVPDTPAGPLTLSGVAGRNGLDVHLVLGAEDAPGGEVLEAGIGAVAGRYAGWPGSALPPGAAGPGVQVMEVESWDPTPRVTLTTPAFTDEGPARSAAPGRAVRAAYRPGHRARPLPGDQPGRAGAVLRRAVHDRLVQRRGLLGGGGDRVLHGSRFGAAAAEGEADQRAVRPAVRLPGRAPRHRSGAGGGLGHRARGRGRHHVVSREP
ncbi:serpin family protein [Streptomyces sp. NPDC007875]|uniref:serpin family protein n=1 Tax=Streptomyces sp. NPDC007875 TaxID=3364783 RepID=UPI00368538EC